MSDQFRRVTEKAKALTIDVAQEATRKAVFNILRLSPVDTGRFKSNWNIALNSPDLSIDSGGGESGLSVIEKWEAGQSLYFTNSLPYSRRLEFGYSNKAPTGMVRITIANFNDSVQDAIKTIGV